MEPVFSASLLAVPDYLPFVIDDEVGAIPGVSSPSSLPILDSGST